MDRITPAAGDSSQGANGRLRIVGVIDVSGGRAVHARGGNRSSYRPVAAVAGTAIDGDAVALARAYVALGIREVYVADLDALEHGAQAMQSETLIRIARVGVPVWLDAGVSTIAAAQMALSVGASIVVAGLETLESFDALRAICSAVGGSRVAFSLDLREGSPIVLPNVAHAATPPVELAARAGRAGARTVIVLDVARVGTGAGIDLGLLASVRAAVPGVALFAGGGVKGASDLTAVAGTGCDGVLVATALLTGAIQV